MAPLLPGDREQLPHAEPGRLRSDFAERLDLSEKNIWDALTSVDLADDSHRTMHAVQNNLISFRIKRKRQNLRLSSDPYGHPRDTALESPGSGGDIVPLFQTYISDLHLVSSSSLFAFQMLKRRMTECSIVSSE